MAESGWGRRFDVASCRRSTPAPETKGPPYYCFSSGVGETGGCEAGSMGFDAGFLGGGL